MGEAALRRRPILRETRKLRFGPRLLQPPRSRFPEQPLRDGGRPVLRNDRGQTGRSRPIRLDSPGRALPSEVEKPILRRSAPRGTRPRRPPRRVARPHRRRFRRRPPERRFRNRPGTRKRRRRPGRSEPLLTGSEPLLTGALAVVCDSFRSAANENRLVNRRFHKRYDRQTQPTSTLRRRRFPRSQFSFPRLRSLCRRFFPRASPIYSAAVRRVVRLAVERSRSSAPPSSRPRRSSFL